MSFVCVMYTCLDDLIPKSLPERRQKGRIATSKSVVMECFESEKSGTNEERKIVLEHKQAAREGWGFIVKQTR